MFHKLRPAQASFVISFCVLATACGGTSPGQEPSSGSFAGDTSSSGGDSTHMSAGGASQGESGSGSGPANGGSATTAGGSNAESGSGGVVPGASGSGGTSGSGSSGTAGSGTAGSGGAVDHGVDAPYVCNLIIGIQTTSEWFGKFEKIADTTRWELMSKDSAHLEKWADPNNTLWSTAKNSPCVNGAEAPERVVFSATNYDYTTVDEFLPKYLAVISNIKTKYPSVKRIDLMTYTRGPNNKECVGANRSADSYIKPAQDEAARMAVAMFPDFVFKAPEWEVASCADFTLCPHLTNNGNLAISATLAKYFDGK